MQLFALFLNFGLLFAIIPHFYFKHFHKLETLKQAEPYYELKDLWTQSEIENLRKLLKKQKVFHTAAQDSTCQNQELEIKVPLNKDGSCPHPYLTPSEQSCILPGRIDIFKHYALTGGKYGAKVRKSHIVFTQISHLFFNRNPWKDWLVMFKVFRNIYLVKI